MARRVTEIRADIERLVAERRDIYRRQQAIYAFSQDLADERAGLDARLRYLWEEMRQARADILRVASMSDGEARIIVGRVPRMALA
jgi:ABC-type phosphate transport system auxiliary subunit